MKELNASQATIGCFEWKEKDAEKLIELYLEESKGSDKLNKEQMALAEAKMIVHDLLYNERKKGAYDDWNNITEWKNPRYYGHPAGCYAKYFNSFYSSSCRLGCPNEKTIDKIYKIMTESKDDSEQKRRIAKLKEKVYEITKALFGVEISYTGELEVGTIYLPNGEISLKIFNDIKFEKKGLINYIIENNEIKPIDFSFNIDVLDDILNKLKDALKDKFKIISLNDFNQKMAKSIDSANVQMNYIFPSTIEYILIFSNKLDGNTQYNSGIIYTITLKPRNLCTEVVYDLVKENVFSEALSKSLAFIKEGFEKVLEFLKVNFVNEYFWINLLLIIIGLGSAFVGIPAPVPVLI